MLPYIALFSRLWFIRIFFILVIFANYVFAAAPSAPKISIVASDGQVSLSWEAIANATTYNVYQGISAGGENNTPVMDNVTGNSVDITGLDNNVKYFFKMTAINDEGEESSLSNEVSAKPIDTPVISATASNAKITLTWAAVNGATGYNIYQGTSLENITLIKKELSGTSLILSSLSNGTTYFFTMEALNKDNALTPRSNVIEATPMAKPVITSIVSGDGKATLSWNSVPGALSYNIYQGATAGFSATTPILTEVINHIIDVNNLTNNTKYYFKIKAINENGASDLSNEVSTIPTAPLAEPVITSAVAGNAQVKLSWTPILGATSYNIYRRASTATTATLITKNATTNLNITTNLSNGTTYFFAVAAFNSYTTSPLSDEVEVTPIANPVINSVLAGDGIVNLSWKVTAGATSYNVYQSTTSGVSTTNAPILSGITTTNASITNLVNGTKYFFKIAAVNSSGSSVSNEVNAQPLDTPDITGTSVSSGQVTLNWNIVNGANSYNLYQRSTTGGTEKLIKTVSGTTTRANIAGLTNGTTYFFTINAINATAITPFSNEVNATPMGSPVISKVVSGDGKATLTWTEVAGATGYNIYQSTTAGITAATSPILTVSGVIKDVTGLTNGTKYYFKIAAVNASSVSNLSNEVNVTPAAPLAAPVITNAQAGNSQVTLTWTSVSSATSYNIYRRTTNGTATRIKSLVTGTTLTISGLINGTTYLFTMDAINPNQISPISNEVSATPAAFPAVPNITTATAGNTQITLTWSAANNANSYNIYQGLVSGGESLVKENVIGTSVVITGLTNGTKYFFKMAAVNNSGISALSNEVNAAPVAPPVAPILEAISGNTQITLKWEAVSDAISYNIYQGTESGNEKIVKSLVTATNINITNLINGKKYFFIVRAINGAGISPLSNEVSVTPIAPPVAPSISAIPGDQQITLNWSVVTNAASYNIYQGSTLIESNVTGTSKVITGLTNGTKYYFKMTAVNTSGVSAFSNQINATPGAAPTAPVITATVTNNQITLNWTAISDATSYTVYRANTVTEEKTLFRTLGKVTTVSLTGANGSRYYFAMKATNSSGITSGFSNEVITELPLTAPVIKLETSNNSLIMLSWQTVSGATSYEIYDSLTANNANPTLLSGLSINVNRTTNKNYVTISNLSGSHFYKIKAINDAGVKSNFSNELSVTLPPAAPVITSAIAGPGSGQVTLTWEAVTGATSYKIYRALISGNQGTTPLLSGITGTSVVISNLSNNIEYFFTMKAVNSGGTSVASNEVNVIPSEVVNNITLLTSSPQLSSAGTDSANITAVVKNSSNVVLSGISVSFKADNDSSLQVTQAVTDTSGQAKATLNAQGSTDNRDITLTATIGSINKTIKIQVTGTALSISGPTSVAASKSVKLTLTMLDSAGNGIADKQLTIKSSNSNDIFSTTSPTTGSNGQITVDYTAASVNGKHTLTVEAYGATSTRTIATSAQLDVTVSADEFSFTTPTAGTEVKLNTDQTLETTWRSSGAAVQGQTVTFSATRGTISAPTQTTDTAGKATTTIQSSNAGSSVVTAQATGGPSTQVSILFVATTPSDMLLQANPATIGTNSSGSTTEQSTITAIVLDKDHNLVKGQTINFTLDDVTGGTISPSAAITDANGTATTVYTANSTASAVNGVKITATANNINKTINLTVAQKALFITLGTGNTISALDSTRYSHPWTVLVNDATGNPVANAQVILKVVPKKYHKGYYEWSNTSILWAPYITAGNCPNEDQNKNGVLDTGEDTDPDGVLTPGNVAAVSTLTTTTGNDGFANFNVIYAKQYANWVNVDLTAQAKVSGSESTKIQNFDLNILASDTILYSVDPPGNPSPFGQAYSCTSSETIVFAVTPYTNYVTLNWTAVSDVATYNVYQNNSKIKSGLTGITDTITGLTNGTTYSFRMEGVNSSGTVIASSRTLTATPLAPPTLNSTSGTNYVILNWNSVVGADSYNIYQNDSLIKTGVTGDPYYVENLVNGTQYKFSISAVNGSGYSDLSNTVNAYTLPSAPTNLITTDLNNTQVTLNWNSDNGTATNYEIYQNGSLIKSGVTGTSYTVTNLTSGTSYTFYVKAINSSGSSSSSSISIITLPSAPTNLTTTNLTTTQVTLNWNSDNGTATNYEIYQNGLLIKSGVTGTSYTVTNLTSGTSYTFYVKAVNSAGSSDYSNSVTATPK